MEFSHKWCPTKVYLGLPLFLLLHSTSLPKSYLTVVRSDARLTVRRSAEFDLGTEDEQHFRRKIETSISLFTSHYLSKVFFSFECSISRITSCLEIDLGLLFKSLNHASKCLDPLDPADSFNPTLQSSYMAHFSKYGE